MSTICMKLDPGIHICMHLVFFSKTGCDTPSSSSSPWLPRRTIIWNRTPWQEDWFEDNEDMQALGTSIVTINNALTVSCSWHAACLLDRT
jgi:hypothetical protein